MFVIFCVGNLYCGDFGGGYCSICGCLVIIFCYVIDNDLL